MKQRWSLLWAARFVAKWEGYLSHAYLDTIASPPVWTIGHGHTHGVRPGQVVTKAEARKLLAADLRDAARAVDAAVTVRLTARQRIACISAVFNLGPGEILHGSGFITKLNRRDYRGAGDELMRWNHAGGVEVQGLTNRRRAERWLMQHPKRRRRNNPHRATASTTRAARLTTEGVTR